MQSCCKFYFIYCFINLAGLAGLFVVRPMVFDVYKIAICHCI